MGIIYLSVHVLLTIMNNSKSMLHNSDDITSLQKEMNDDHLPSLTKQSGPYKSNSANMTRINSSLHLRPSNNCYKRLTRSYTNPEMVPHQIAQSYTAKPYFDPGQSRK